MSLTEFPLPDYSAGDPISASKAERVVDAVRDLQRQVSAISPGGGPVGVKDIYGQSFVVEQFLGVTTETPPQGQVAYSDAQYYVSKGIPDPRGQAIGGGGGSQGYIYDKIAVPQKEPVSDWQETITATNLSELPAGASLTNRGTHGVPDKTPVHVFGAWLRTDPHRKLYWFVFGGSESVGEEMGQVRIMTAQNVAGFDFPRCHAMESDS